MPVRTANNFREHDTARRVRPFCTNIVSMQVLSAAEMQACDRLTNGTVRRTVNATHSQCGFVNAPWPKVTAWTVAVVIAGLNAWLLVQTVRGGHGARAFRVRTRKVA